MALAAAGLEDTQKHEAILKKLSGTLQFRPPFPCRTRALTACLFVPVVLQGVPLGPALLLYSDKTYDRGPISRVRWIRGPPRLFVIERVQHAPTENRLSMLT